jgi:hypothetical protein
MYATPFDWRVPSVLRAPRGLFQEYVDIIGQRRAELDKREKARSTWLRA